MAEPFTAQVINGVIVPDADAPPLPEGTRVRVEPIDMDQAVRDLSRVLMEFAGTLEGLPPDMAEQHDHYIHGTPKR